MRAPVRMMTGLAGAGTVLAGAIGAGAGEVWAAVIAGVCLVGSVLLQSHLLTRSHEQVRDTMTAQADAQAMAIERLTARVDEMMAANQSLIDVIARLADASAAHDHDR